jgi:ATP-dependent RNA helicase SUPV3L1/SUV3
LQRLAGSGRTSIPVDKETPKALYRTIGYRVCGERAIRVDILERLADLIRPALAWREGVNPRPPGAFNGFGFTVTGAMTSLTGASGEDFASILRSLGYRMEKRAKPPEPETAASATEPAASAAVAEAPAATEEATTTEHAPTLAPESEPVADAAIDALPLAETSTAETPASPAEPASVAENAAAAGDVAAAPDAPATTASEPDMIEVWRPGRPQGERRPRDVTRRGRRHRERPGAKPDAQITADAPAVAASTEQTAGGPAEAAAIAAPERERHERRGRPHRRRREEGEETQREARAERPDRRERRDRRDRSDDRGDRREYSGRPRRDRDRDRRDDNRPSRTWTSDQQPRGKDPDPNSPFAKLLALKEQLEANKERQ